MRFECKSYVHIDMNEKSQRTHLLQSASKIVVWKKSESVALRFDYEIWTFYPKIWMRNANLFLAELIEEIHLISTGSRYSSHVWIPFVPWINRHDCQMSTFGIIFCLEIPHEEVTEGYCHSETKSTKNQAWTRISQNKLSVTLFFVDVSFVIVN